MEKHARGSISPSCWWVLTFWNLSKSIYLIEGKDPKVVSYDRITNTSKETKDEFTLGYFINSNAIDEKGESLIKYKDSDAKLNKLINDYIYDENQNIEKFINKTKEYYTEALKNKEKRISNITNIYNNFIAKHKNTILESEKIFKWNIQISEYSDILFL